MRMSTPARVAQFLLTFTAICAAASAWAGETVLYSFPGGAGGQSPQGTLAIDSSGNVYGTTIGGGVSNNRGGCGVVFELSPAAGGAYTPSVLYTFQGTSAIDGCNPYSGIILDSAGNLYGTTLQGGVDGCGTVFELVRASAWAENILWNFTCETDGAYPTTNVVFDSEGNAYGTASAGGNLFCTLNGAESGCGTVYELTPTVSGEWNETTLHQFAGPDGISPGPLSTTDGELFGTTYFGGPPDAPFCTSEYGCGVVFNLESREGSFEFHVIYGFGTTGATDGIEPTGVVLAEGPNLSILKGATNGGGSTGNGTIWQLTASGGGPWTYSTIYSFPGGTDGAGPNSPVLAQGNLDGIVYGTARGGGNSHCSGGCGVLYGVFGSEEVLVRFNKSDGDEDASFGSGLIRDSAGNLYGVTASGGTSGNGLVYEFIP
jgi:uncharacterized repeat protein (TIGR03803 family)